LGKSTKKTNYTANEKFIGIVFELQHNMFNFVL